MDFEKNRRELLQQLSKRQRIKNIKQRMKSVKSAKPVKSSDHHIPESIKSKKEIILLSMGKTVFF